MKALITGGAGFVGSHLAEALLARGDTVHVLDNLSTGSMDNIGHLKGRDRFHYIVDTVMNERVDRFLMPTGWLEVAVAGLFVVRDGKIVLWRDYFDLAAFTKAATGGS